MARCRNCINYKPLAAPNTGGCPVNAEPGSLRRINAGDSGCERFEPKHPVKRRRAAAVKPSADAVLIAESIDRGFRWLCEATTNCLRDQEGGTVKDSLTDMAVILERIADHLEQ